MKNRLMSLLLAAALFASAFTPNQASRVFAADDTETQDGQNATEGTDSADDVSVISAPDGNTSPVEPLAEMSGSAKPGEELKFDLDITYSKYKTYFSITSDVDTAGTISLTGEGETEAGYNFDFATVLPKDAEETVERECTFRRNPAVKKYAGVLKFNETEENKDQTIKYTFKIYAGTAYVDESKFESIEIKNPGEYALELTKGYKRTVKIRGYASGSSLSFKSSNKKVAKVNKKGVIKGVKKGKAVISVSGTDERGYAFIFKLTVKVKNNVYTHSKISKKSVSKKKPSAEVIKAYFKRGNLLVDLQVYNPRSSKLISMLNVKVSVYDANDKLVGTVKQIYLPTNLGKKKSGIYTLTILKKDLKKKKADIGRGSIGMSGFRAVY